MREKEKHLTTHRAPAQAHPSTVCPLIFLYVYTYIYFKASQKIIVPNVSLWVELLFLENRARSCRRLTSNVYEDVIETGPSPKSKGKERMGPGTCSIVPVQGFGNLFSSELLKNWLIY